MARILVVDDDPQVRRLLSDLLRSDGHDVVLAADGQIGVELYRQSPADLVLLDIYMPEQAGLEAMLELRDEFPDARVIAMSGGEGTFGLDPLKSARHLGALLTLSKPFSRSDLLTAVEEVLRGSP